MLIEYLRELRIFDLLARFAVKGNVAVRTESVHRRR